MSETQLMPPNLEETVRRIKSVSTLPDVALKIIQITSDPKSSVADLENVINGDPGLTAKIIKMVNSAHFGLSEKIMKVHKAIVFLGFKSVRDLALSASVCDLFQQDESIGHYTRPGLWKHSVGVAITAKLIAQKTEFNVGDFVFSTSIMHDIGIVMLDQYLHDHLIECMLHPECLRKGLHNIESEIVGFSHQDLAGKVVETWELPKEFSEVCLYHHRPRSASYNSRPICSIVYLANILCDARQFGFVESSDINSADFNFALKTLNFKKTDISIILEELPSQLKTAADLINLVDH